jgi:sigma-B regulation protein RsbU (phosphoserine phosphatase)
MIIMYTDGITETQDGSGELFGRERLCRVVYDYRGAPPEVVIDGVLAEVRSFSGSEAFQDDISLVVMKID